jgi:hypothetical protein
LSPCQIPGEGVSLRALFNARTLREATNFPLIDIKFLIQDIGVCIHEILNKCILGWYQDTRLRHK